MFDAYKIAVVIPAFNEEYKINGVLEGTPSYVDFIVVVDDCSTDGTHRMITECATRDSRIFALRHTTNRGVGAAIVSGYRESLSLGAEICVVMAGDGQMDPFDLPTLLGPVIRGDAEYAKGNRFADPDVWKAMPKPRLLGNIILSSITKITSGYGHVFDSQCGYTAIDRNTLLELPLAELYPRYGYPNHMLALLHSYGKRVVDVPVRALYGPEWKSGIVIPAVISPISKLLFQSWMGRLVSENRRRLKKMRSFLPKSVLP